MGFSFTLLKLTLGFFPKGEQITQIAASDYGSYTSSAKMRVTADFRGDVLGKNEVNLTDNKDTFFSLTDNRSP